MSRFGRAISHLKSTQIDEKIKVLNKELEKTGVISETPANSTANFYYSSQEVAATPEETTAIPDPDGFSNGGTQNVNGGDESDPNTWGTGWNNITDMKNPNDVDGETDRNIPITPDLSGWTPSTNTSRSSNNPIGSTYGGIATWTISSGIGGGTAIGTLTAGNEFVFILQPSNIGSTWYYPVVPKGSDGSNVYAWYSESEYQAAINMAEAYQANQSKGYVTREVWVPYEQATSHGGPTYAEYTGAKKTTTTTDYDGNSVTHQWKLKEINILKASNSYVSRPAVAAYDVITRDSLDDAKYYPGNPNKFMDFLRGALDVGEKAFDWLSDKAGIDAEDNTASKINNALDKLIDTLGTANPLARVLSVLPVFDYSREIAVSMATNEVVSLGNEDVSEADKRNYINRISNDVFNEIEVNTSEENYADGNFYVDDNGKFQSNLGPNGEQGYVVGDRTSGISGATTVAGAVGDMVQAGANNRIASRGKNQTQIVMDDDGNPVLVINDYAYINNKSKDKDEIPSTLGKFNPKQWVSDQLHKVTDELSGRTEGKKNSHGTTIGPDMTTPNTGELSGIPPNIRGLSHLKVTIPFDKWPADKKKIWNERKDDKGEFFSNTGTYTFESKVLEEGWESPKHTYIDKDQQKRWFNADDVAPVYPKDPPPQMINGYHPKLLPKSQHSIPFIKVTKKDLIRSHKLTKDEAQEMIQLVDRLNEFIKNNPDKLAYARERYPKDDVRLAELNFKLDMQLAAADDYLETQFPENKRRLKLIQRAVKKSTELTDPKTYKKKSKYLPFEDTGILRTVNDLEVHGAPTRKKKTRKKNKWIQKPKKKTKQDMMNEKMNQLEIDMKKTIPDL